MCFSRPSWSALLFLAWHGTIFSIGVWIPVMGQSYIQQRGMFRTGTKKQRLQHSPRKPPTSVAGMKGDMDKVVSGKRV